MHARNTKGQFVSGPRKVNQYGWELYCTDLEKECRKCGRILPHSAFHQCKTTKYGTTYSCKECACKRARENYAIRKTKSGFKEGERNRQIRGAHGITLSEYREKLVLQNSQCAICKVKLLDHGHYTHLDHCHKTGKLRAFLCTNCNRGLGYFQDNVEFLSSAAQYLKFYAANEAGEVNL